MLVGREDQIRRWLASRRRLDHLKSMYLWLICVGFSIQPNIELAIVGPFLYIVVLKDALSWSIDNDRVLLDLIAPGKIDATSDLPSKIRVQPPWMAIKPVVSFVQWLSLVAVLSMLLVPNFDFASVFHFDARWLILAFLASCWFFDELIEKQGIHFHGVWMGINCLGRSSYILYSDIKRVELNKEKKQLNVITRSNNNSAICTRWLGENGNLQDLLASIQLHGENVEFDDDAGVVLKTRTCPSLSI